MIKYIEKGAGLHQIIVDSGQFLIEKTDRDGSKVWESSDDALVQDIIDSYDPLPDAQDQARRAVSKAAGQARERVTPLDAGQVATYLEKYNVSLQCRDDGYPENNKDNYKYLTVVMKNKSVIESSEENKLKAAADLIINTRNQWNEIDSLIEGIRETGNQNIDGETDYAKIPNIVAKSLNELENLT